MYNFFVCVVGVISLLPFPDSESMEIFMASENSSTRFVYGGIVFTNIEDEDVLPELVKYTLRPRAEGVTQNVRNCSLFCS